MFERECLRVLHTERHRLFLASWPVFVVNRDQSIEGKVEEMQSPASMLEYPYWEHGGNPQSPNGR